MGPETIRIVTPEEYRRMQEAEEAARQRPRNASELREEARECLLAAERWLRLIVLEEGPGGRAGRANWGETRSLLLEIADHCKRDAAQAMARAEALEGVSTTLT